MPHGSYLLLPYASRVSINVPTTHFSPCVCGLRDYFAFSGYRIPFRILVHIIAATGFSPLRDVAKISILCSRFSELLAATTERRLEAISRACA
jgi:hypothetical protein